MYIGVYTMLKLFKKVMEWWITFHFKTNSFAQAPTANLLHLCLYIYVVRAYGNNSCI